MLLLISEYTDGATTRDKSVELIMPHTTAMARGPLVSEPAPVPMAAGKRAKMIVSDVIRIGRIRMGQASFNAVSISLPSLRS